jgi:hypothetical protein
MKRFVTCSVICISVFLLAGCLSVKSAITLTENGSGKLRLTYTVSKMMANVGKSDEDSRFIPLPVNREDFESKVNAVKGLSLTSYKQGEDTENIIVEAEVAFDQVEKLSVLYGRSLGEGLSLKNEGGKRVFSQFIYEGLSGEPDPESLSLIETMFKGYELSFSLVAPSRILSSNLGSVQNNVVTYTISILDLMKRTEPLSLEVSF